MSQLRKSASFRSRIPVRRTKVPQRRCSSPQPTSSYSSSRQNSRQNKSHNLWYDRRYSSSSFSSSDESDESEAPLQLLLKQSATAPAHGMSRLMNDSTDAMSLGELLDSVSSYSGSFSHPHSPTTPHTFQAPKMDRNGNRFQKAHSSYESLDQFNNALETLRVTDDYHLQKQLMLGAHNPHMQHNVIITSNDHQLKPVQPQKNYMLNTQLIHDDRDRQIDHIDAAADDDSEAAKQKQRKLSDWYYIKTSPKAKPSSPYERRRLKNYNNYTTTNYATRNETNLQKSVNSKSNEKLSSTTQIEIQDKYASNDFIEKRKMFEQKSPIQSYKCFNMKYKSSPKDSTNFGEVTSSSFEHVNADQLYVNHNVDNDQRHQISHFNSKLKEAMMRPLPKVPDNKYYPNKATNPQSTTQATTPSSYRTECELSGSYVSLECPSPPGPPACLSDNRRDPQSRLVRYLKTLYIELALREPIIPPWTQPVSPGSLCAARLEPELRLHNLSHGLNECISVDDLLTSIQTKEGPFLEAPRRVLIECSQWVPRSSLALRILHSWAKKAPWPIRGQPVALALFVPLNELKGTLHNFISKELLPKGPPNPFASGFGGFNSAWNTLEALKGKLLIVLDGYEVSRFRGANKNKNKNAPQDIIDLLEGKLFPEARVILISVSSGSGELLPLMQRHVKYEGLTWGRSASLLGGGQWGAPTRLLDIVQNSQHLRNVVRTPFGCLAIASIYETNNGELPTDEIDVIESTLNCVAPNKSQATIAELGRLALFCLKTKRLIVSSTEIRMYCSSPETSFIGCFDKASVFGKTAKRKSEYSYSPICQGISEFLAANYLVSLSNRPGLLAAEIAGLSLGDDLEVDILKVLTFAMALLGNRAHVLLSKLTPLWLSPQTVFSLALAGGETEANLNALSDLLGISKAPPISPLETKPIWVSIKSSPNELQGWGLALKSPICALKNLELMYQVEKHMLLDTRNDMDIFLDALSRNESVTTLRITSLIENDARDAEINHLAACVAKALLKPRLESFELILTLLEEDPPALKLQSVVTALCKSIPRQTKLVSLLLDLSLCTSQLVQVCSALEKCPHINRLALPHLRCERGAINALAVLLNTRPLSSLALPSCWGARDDPPSSSGVSMGSGSGSSSGTNNSGLIKQGSLTGAPSPRSYPPGLFSSLPRGALATSANMGRSATLPRQPIEGPPDKRSQDSVISRTWYPTPACEGGPHNSGTLHDLLLAARDSYSRLHGLDLSKAQLSLEDSMCLGETVRLSTTLHSIKLEGASRLSEILPTVLGASESPSLQMMSLGSPRLVLEDTAVAMSARALGCCITLRLLSLDGWSFRIENVSTLAQVRGFLSLTSVRELGLSNCRLNLPMFKGDITMSSDAYECRSVVVLKMAGAQVILADHIPLRGPQLLPYLGGFPCLRELDLSAPARSGLGSSTCAPFILGDKCIVNFFHHINGKFNLLNTLKICNWIIHLDDAPKTLKSISKGLKSCTISHMKIDGVSVMDRPKKHRIEAQFMQTILSSMPMLRWISMSLAGISEEQMTFIGNSICDIKSNEIDIRLSDSTIENARLMTQSLSMDGKFDIRVSTFGTSSSSILIHVEKTGTKSLTRKQKD